MAIEWNRNGVLDWTFQVMRATDRGKIEKNRKKNYSFSTTCCYKFSISPNVDTVLESPRPSASNGTPMSAANLNGGGSRGRYLAIFSTFFPIGTSDKPFLHRNDIAHKYLGHSVGRTIGPAICKTTQHPSVRHRKKVRGQKPPEKCIFRGFSIFSRSSVDLGGF